MFTTRDWDHIENYSLEFDDFKDLWEARGVFLISQLQQAAAELEKIIDSLVRISR